MDLWNAKGVQIGDGTNTQHFTIHEAPAPAPPAVLATLPRRVGAFTGRGAELERLTQAAGPGDVMVIHTVDGMAGVGKTTLATEAAHRVADRYPDGQLFVELQAHTEGLSPSDPSDVLAHLLARRGIHRQAVPDTLDERAAMWRDHAARHRILLVLDDAADRAQIEPLLPASPHCLVLITSRTRLTFLDGAESPVALAAPPPDEAALMFTRLAHRTPTTPADHAAVDRVVHRCGHLPIAIALLAGRLAHHPDWDITTFATDFEHAHDVLDELDDDDRAVQAAFHLSYRDLTPDQRHLFRRLGLHPGPDIDPHATAALHHTTVARARATLRALDNQHLLDQPVPGRYRLHDLVRHYTRKLTLHDPQPDRADALERLLDHYQHTAHAADRHLARHTRAGTPSTPSPPTTPRLDTRENALAWMRAEHPNLLACVDHTTHHQPLRVIALTTAMAAFLDQEGLWTQAAHLHRTAAHTAHTLSDRLGEANALHALGRARHMLGRHAAALAAHEHALDLYRALGSRFGEANALTALGNVRRVLGEYPAAVAAYEHSLDLCRTLGHRHGEANALNQLGRARRVLGEYPAAITAHEHALDLCRTLGLRHGEANVLNDLGRARHMLGEYPAAIAAHEHSLDLCRTLGYRLGEANALNQLGRARRVLGEYPAAITAHEHALDLFLTLGHRLGEASALTGLGVARRVLGEYPAAITAHEHALDLFRTLGHRHSEAFALTGLGDVLRLLGEYSQAGDLYEQALRLMREFWHRDGEVDTINSMGALRDETNGPREGLAVYERALIVARGIDYPIGLAHTLEGIARCRTRLGEHDAAVVGLREAVGIYQRLGVPERQTAAELLAGLKAHRLDDTR